MTASDSIKLSPTEFPVQLGLWEEVGVNSRKCDALLAGVECVIVATNHVTTWTCEVIREGDVIYTETGDDFAVVYFDAMMAALDVLAEPVTKIARAPMACSCCGGTIVPLTAYTVVRDQGPVHAVEIECDLNL